MEKIQLIKGFLWIRYDVFDNENLSGSDMMVYAVLMRHMNNETKKCFPAISTLASQARLHKDTVIKSLKKLEEEQLIYITKDDGKVNHYLLLEPTSRKNPTGRNEGQHQSELEQRTILKNNTNGILCPNEEIKEIITHLNEKTGKNFRDDNQKTIKLLNARLKDYTKTDVKAVIDIKCAKWLGTDYQIYLRPITLFNVNKFESYVNEIDVEGSESRGAMPLQELQ